MQLHYLLQTLSLSCFLFVVLCTRRSLLIARGPWHCCGEIPCEEHLDINGNHKEEFSATIQTVLSAGHQPDLGITVVSEPKETYSLDIMIPASDLKNQ